MKSVAVFDMRDFDEAEWFEKYSQELGLTLSPCPDAPDMENIARVTEGCECVDIITSQITREMMEEFAKSGIRYITTRTIGYDHIDLEAAKEFGIHVGNAPYGPNGVADYTVMLILMSIRKMKRILERTNIQDYTLQGIQGRELKDLTVGVIGTGRIGRTVIRNLSGFGCRILAYDLYENEEVKEHASYVPLKELWKEADVITLHTPLTEENHYLINKESLAMMKDGVVILNYARDLLVNDDDITDALANGKVRRYMTDFPNEKTGQMVNVIATPHLGASTSESEDNCAVMAVDELRDFLETGRIRNSVNYPSCALPPEKCACRICIMNVNKPNMIVRFSAILSDAGINIPNMTNKSRGNAAYTLIDCDTLPSEELIDKIRDIDGVKKVRVIYH